MTVYVLEECWDIEDGPQSDVIGVFDSLEKAKNRMICDYQEDIENLEWKTNENTSEDDVEEPDYEVERTEYGILVYSMYDYPRIEYSIYTKEIQ